ncbi:MAG TPA: TIGR03435 family protein [Bryobacteraceae bacterium]|nr:TIGR03435 family protein [Bryobacteraceae bacterium]
MYSLTVAKNGPKLSARARATAESLRLQPIDRNGANTASRGSSSGRLRLNKTSLADSSANLSRGLDRPAVDATGIAGTFNFDLRHGGTSASAVSKALGRQPGLQQEAGSGTVEMWIVEGGALP